MLPFLAPTLECTRQLLSITQSAEGACQGLRRLRPSGDEATGTRRPCSHTPRHHRQPPPIARSAPRLRLPGITSRARTNYLLLLLEHGRACCPHERLHRGQRASTAHRPDIPPVWPAMMAEQTCVPPPPDVFPRPKGREPAKRRLRSPNHAPHSKHCVVPHRCHWPY